jgi:hypothetical protein
MVVRGVPAEVQAEVLRALMRRDEPEAQVM